MVSAGTKRKRRERGNRVAIQVEDGKRQSDAERKALGTKITPEAPDDAIFFEDRIAESKGAIKQLIQQQAAEQRRAAKRARRSAPKARRSEAACQMNVDTPIGAGKVPGKKKKKGIASVDMEILAKRNFDKPEGHVGNKSGAIRQRKVHSNGTEDVWMSEISEKVKGEIGLNRRRLTEKMNTSHRQAQSVMRPSSGLSVNPTHTAHQDKLGEALAKIIAADDDMKWDEKKMSFDPALLQESTEGEIGDTGMKGDDTMDDSEVESDTEPVLFSAGVAERKTRAQRNKEARKRVMAANIARKKADAKRLVDFDNLDVISKEAKAEAEKLDGTAKEKWREAHPRRRKNPAAPVNRKIAGQRVRNERAGEPVVLSSELSESMRSIKMPVANPVLRDRFLSFERRGMIVPQKVIPKEIWRINQAEEQDRQRDKRKRKGRGSRSNLTFWKNGKKVIQ